MKKTIRNRQIIRAFLHWSGAATAMLACVLVSGCSSPVEKFNTTLRQQFRIIPFRVYNDGYGAGTILRVPRDGTIEHLRYTADRLFKDVQDQPLSLPHETLSIVSGIRLSALASIKAPLVNPRVASILLSIAHATYDETTLSVEKAKLFMKPEGAMNERLRSIDPIQHDETQLLSDLASPETSTLSGVLQLQGVDYRATSHTAFSNFAEIEIAAKSAGLQFQKISASEFILQDPSAFYYGYAKLHIDDSFRQYLLKLSKQARELSLEQHELTNLLARVKLTEAEKQAAEKRIIQLKESIRALTDEIENLRMRPPVTENAPIAPKTLAHTNELEHLLAGAQTDTNGTSRPLNDRRQSLKT